MYSSRSAVPFTDEPALWKPLADLTFKIWAVVSNHKSPSVTFELVGWLAPTKYVSKKSFTLLMLFATVLTAAIDPPVRLTLAIEAAVVFIEAMLVATVPTSACVAQYFAE